MSYQSSGKFSEESWLRVVAFLQRKYPSKTADCVSADTGIIADTVRKLLAGCSRPTWGNTLRLVKAYKAPLLEAAFLDDPEEWVSRASRDAELRATMQELERVKLKLRALENC
jgi:hypothetical protein